MAEDKGSDTGGRNDPVLLLIPSRRDGTNDEGELSMAFGLASPCSPTVPSIGGRSKSNRGFESTINGFGGRDLSTEPGLTDESELDE